MTRKLSAQILESVAARLGQSNKANETRQSAFGAADDASESDLSEDKEFIRSVRKKSCVSVEERHGRSSFKSTRSSMNLRSVSMKSSASMGSLACSPSSGPPPKLSLSKSKSAPVLGTLANNFASQALIIQRMVHLRSKAFQATQFRKLYVEFETKYGALDPIKLRFKSHEMQTWHDHGFTFENYSWTRRTYAMLVVLNAMLYCIFQLPKMSASRQSQFIFEAFLVTGPVLLVLHEIFKLSLHWNSSLQRAFLTTGFLIIIVMSCIQDYILPATPLLVATLTCANFALSSSDLSHFHIASLQPSKEILWLILHFGIRQLSLDLDFAIAAGTLVFVSMLCQVHAYAMDKLQKLLTLESSLSKLVAHRVSPDRDFEDFDMLDLLVQDRRRSVENMFSTQMQVAEDLHLKALQARNEPRSHVIQSMGQFVRHERQEAAEEDKMLSEGISCVRSGRDLSMRLNAFDKEQAPTLLHGVHKRLSQSMTEVKGRQALASKKVRTSIRNWDLGFDDRQLELRIQRELGPDIAALVVRLRAGLLLVQIFQGLFIHTLLQSHESQMIHPCRIIHGVCIVLYIFLPDPRKAKEPRAPFQAHLLICSIELLSKLILLGLSSHNNFYAMQMLLAFVTLFTTVAKDYHLAAYIAVGCLLVEFLILTLFRRTVISTEFILALYSVAVVGIGIVACERKEALMRIHFMLRYHRVERAQLMVNGTY